MPIQLKLSLILAVLIALLATSIARPAEVDLKQLAATGAKSFEKLQTMPASWEVSHTFDGGVIRISVLRSADKQRIIFAIDQGPNRLEVCRIIERENLWYISDAWGVHKYRPYEALFARTSLYLCLHRSEPTFVDDPASDAVNGKLEGMVGNIATFRRPVPPETARGMQHLIDQMNSLAIRTGRPPTPETQASLDFLKDTLVHGTATRVDVSTGQVLEFGSEKLRTRADQLKFLDKVDEAEFAVDNHQWIDCSDDPTTGNLDDLIMICNAPLARFGENDRDMDCRLLDVKTGRFRRIPFEGGPVGDGCFLKGRKAVVVNGMSPQTGMIRPYSIDLKTRSCEPLGGQLFDTGMSVGADLSPDGKTVVITHMDPTGGGSMFESQICLIDLATGIAKPLGKPMDAGCVSWAADGQHLVLSEHKSKSIDAPIVQSVCIMDLHGNVKTLRPGRIPVLLADRKTILYQDNDTNLWHTCDLEGESDKLYGNGLKNYLFPCPAPDGKRILMMHATPGDLPQPVILPVGESSGEVMPHGDGFWCIAAWR